MSPDALSHAEIHAAASQWTLQGIALMEQGAPEDLHIALDCFEQAIQLRETLPLDEEPLYRWGLTAGWINRGDALTRLGGAERLTEALRCYDIAIGHLHRLPLEAEPAYRWRLAIAWVNRGLAERAHCNDRPLQRAHRCFQNALTVMRGHEASPLLDYQQVMASAWMNLAAVQLELPGHDLNALDSARHAIQHNRPCETAGTAQSLEVGMKARHVLCRTVATLLEAPGEKDSNLAESWIHEATDAVEEVMHLTRNEVTPHALREEIFHFGCRIYRAFQPHFLAEFLEEGLASGSVSGTMKEAARQSLHHAAVQIQNENLASLNPEKMDRLLQTLRALSETSQKLK